MEFSRSHVKQITLYLSGVVSLIFTGSGWFPATIESHVAPETQAWNRISAAPAGLLVDPGVGHFEPGGKFLGREDVVGLHHTCRCLGPGGAWSRGFRLVVIAHRWVPFPALEPATTEPRRGR